MAGKPRKRVTTARPACLLALILCASISEAKDVFGAPLAPNERSASPLKIGRRLRSNKGSSRISKKSKVSKGASISSKGAKSSSPSLSGKSAKKSKISKRSKGVSPSKASHSETRRRPKGGHAAQKKNDSNDLDKILRAPDIAASLGVVNEEDLLDAMEAEWSSERIEMEQALLEGSQQ